MLLLPRSPRWSAYGISVLVQIQELPSFSVSGIAFLFYFVVVLLLTFVVALFLFDDEIDPGHPVVDQLTGGERG